MFKKILIANRGEIACRIIATAKRMGIHTVAVHSDIDRTALHVALADESVSLGGAAPRDSYLRAEAIIAAALQTGAQAIHPGYGFLSENADFADACAKAGLVFIGPPASAIRAMGLKDAAKRLMQDAGVPILPGYHDENQDEEVLLTAARRIGWPILIKAVAGGGGKGMRRVDHESEFLPALQAAQREGLSSFGDGRVLIEKYLTKPRHIEIQVFADSHGNAVYLHERDCSLQRRHQKVIEEAPAPGMPADMRRAMGEAACAAARAVGYAGAGTVEFIADVSDGLRADRFYFMEMNTRLQVEHPVTEMITGLDLVEWQIQVATGAALPLSQDKIPLNGHAFEARLYAEDPQRDFLPAIGQLDRLRFPLSNAQVRIDTGVREGDVVSPYYDPMIAKLIVWGHDRKTALARLAEALGECQIAGLSNNLTFLARTANHPEFIDADIDTGFIERNRRELIPEPAPLDRKAIALATLGVLLDRHMHAFEKIARSKDPTSPWNAVDGWRLNDEGREDMAFWHQGQLIPVHIIYDFASWRLQIEDFQIRAEGILDDQGWLRARLDGHSMRVGFHKKGHDITVFRGAEFSRMRLHDPIEVEESEDFRGDKVLSPMPGRIVRLLVEEGAQVAKNQPLAIIEAMKMEHTVSAPLAGTVESLYFIAGDQVEEGAELMKLTEAAP